MKAMVFLAYILIGLIGCRAQFPQSESQFDFLGVKPYTFTSHEGDTMQAELGRLRVPENRGDPNSNLITLAFMERAKNNL